MRIDHFGSFHPHFTLFDAQRVPERVVNSVQVLVVGYSGHGKTLCSEKLVEQYSELGYTIIYITEKPSVTYEPGFAAFPAYHEYHKKYLKQQSQKPVCKKIKLYHPATLNIPKNKLPPINFFTIPLKSLSTQELTVLLEVESRHDSVSILQSQLRQLRPDESLHDLLWRADISIKRQSEKLTKGVNIPKFDDEWLIPSPSSGSASNIKDIKSAFDSFQTHYMLATDASELNINWTDLINDNTHYHIFGRWLIPESDDRLVYFVVNHILNQISVNSDNLKTKGIVLVVPEAKVFLPDKSRETYIQKTADNFERKLSTLRTKGISSIADSQNYFSLAEGYRGSCNETLIGQLDASDTERYTKSIGYASRMRVEISKLPKNEWFRKGNNERIAMLFPKHAHKEEKEDFFSVWKKYSQIDSEKYFLVDHSSVLKLIKENKRFDLSKAKSRVDELKSSLRKKARDKKAAELAAERIREGEISKKKAVEEEVSNLDIQKKILIYKQSTLNVNNPEPYSWVALSKEHGITDKTAKKYAAEGKALSEDATSNTNI